MRELIARNHATFESKKASGHGKKGKRSGSIKDVIPDFEDGMEASGSFQRFANSAMDQFKKSATTSQSPNAQNKKAVSNTKKEPLYVPRTPNQTLYLKYLTDVRNKIVLGVGPAGCGKTLFACHRAIEELRSGRIDKIIITRPMVAVEDESVGFLPGDLNQKMAPWTRPIFDIFHEYYSQEDVEEMVRTGIVEISPLAYMRGRTFKNAFIIADEMQNSTPNQMLMVSTRLGENTRMAITGDLKQSDKAYGENGLRDLMWRLSRYPDHGHGGIKMVQLSSEDVCRSAIVSKVLDIYSDILPHPLPVQGTCPVTPLGTFTSSSSKFSETYLQPRPQPHSQQSPSVQHIPERSSDLDGGDYEFTFDTSVTGSSGDDESSYDNSHAVGIEIGKYRSVSAPPLFHNISQHLQTQSHAPTQQQIQHSANREIAQSLAHSVSKLLGAVARNESYNSCTSIERVPTSAPTAAPISPTTRRAPSKQSEHGSSDCAIISKRDLERIRSFDKIPK